MLEVRAVSCTLILTLVIALASSNALLGVQRAWADSVTKTITVGTGPYGDLFDPDNGHIYVANVASNSVSVIDGSTNTVVATITEPSNQTPRELAVNLYKSVHVFIFLADRLPIFGHDS